MGRNAGKAMSERRALLLTDIVDSTATAEALGDAAAAALWSAHDRSARDLLPVWRGREIDKTDGMLLLFDHAADALGYARAYNQAIRLLPVPISSRAGLHFADVTLRENSAADVLLGAKPLEVDGVAKPLAARVMALARGGQILLTAEARESLGEEVAAQVSSHGHWAIKGIAEPVELFEAGEAGMTLSAPTDGDKAYRVTRVGDRWVPVKEIPNNLPQLMTSFQGRERELVDVKGAARARPPGNAARHGRLGQDPAVDPGRGRSDARVSRRGVVHRPCADPRLRTRRQRGGAGARRDGGARQASHPDPVQPPEDAARPLDSRQLRAPNQGGGRAGERCPAHGAQGMRPGLEPGDAARSRRADLSGSSTPGAGARRQRRSAAALARGEALHRPCEAASTVLQPDQP